MSTMATKGFLMVLLCFSSVLTCVSQSLSFLRPANPTVNSPQPMSTTSFAMQPMSGAANQMTADHFSTGPTPTTTTTTSSSKLKNVHGVLSVVGWGILFPIGLYFRVNGHQIIGSVFSTAGYIIGVIGWGTGVKLGHGSPGIAHDTHMILGILTFCFAHVKSFSLCVTDISGSFVTAVISIVTIYQGFHVVQPDHHKWRNIYTGVLISLGCIAAVWEITKCIIFCLLSNFSSINYSKNRTEPANGGAVQNNGSCV